MNRDYRGKYGQKADTAKPVWRPANHPKFNSKSEMKNVSIRFTRPMWFGAEIMCQNLILEL